jgi:hypothetical protein
MSTLSSIEFITLPPAAPQIRRPVANRSQALGSNSSGSQSPVIGASGRHPEPPALRAGGVVTTAEGESQRSGTPVAAEPAPAIGHHPITPAAGDDVMTSTAPPVVSPKSDDVLTSAPTPAAPATGDEVITGAALIAEVEEYLTDYIKLDPIYPLPLALFLAYTHCWYECFPVAPQVIVTAATSQSGKSALIEIMSFASARPWLYSRVTPAALYRIITDRHPTIYLDEAEKLNSEKSEYRDVLDGGYRQGQMVQIVIGNSLVDFSNFCPKVFGLIGDLYDALRDRSIIIALSRRMGKAPKLRYSYFLAKERGEKLAPRLNKLITPRFKEIETAYAESAQQNAVLSFLADRDREIWEPLFVLCQLLCPERLPELEKCAADIAANKTHDLRRISADAERNADEAVASERALKDMELVTRGRDRITSADSIPALRALPTGGWSNYRRPGGITNDVPGEMLLSHLLSRFGVSPGTIRVGPKDTPHSTLQGYKRADIVAAMEAHGIEPHAPTPSLHHTVITEPTVPVAVPDPAPAQTQTQKPNGKSGSDNPINDAPAHLRKKRKKQAQPPDPEPGVKERVIEALLTNGCSHSEAIEYEHDAVGVTFNERFTSALDLAKNDWNLMIEELRVKKSLTVVEARECFIAARTLCPDGDRAAIIAKACELADIAAEHKKKK